MNQYIDHDHSSRSCRGGVACHGFNWKLRDNPELSGAIWHPLLVMFVLSVFQVCIYIYMCTYVLYIYIHFLIFLDHIHLNPERDAVLLKLGFWILDEKMVSQSPRVPMTGQIWKKTHHLGLGEGIAKATNQLEWPCLIIMFPTATSMYFNVFHAPICRYMQSRFFCLTSRFGRWNPVSWFLPENWKPHLPVSFYPAP